MFTSPEGCRPAQNVLLEAKLHAPAPEGIRGAFVVTEDRSGEKAGDSCPETAVFPPADGPIAETWANCGFYDTPVSPPHAVHSLYNGAVWIAYSPDIDADALVVIRSTATRTSHVLASPVAGMDDPIVISAWRRQIRLDDVADPRFDEFVTAYLHAPHRPVTYAPCRDGQGEPEASFWEHADS